MIMACQNLMVAQSRPVLLHSSVPREKSKKVMCSCNFEHPISNKVGDRQVLSGLAASVVILSQTHLVRTIILSCLCGTITPICFTLSMFLEDDYILYKDDFGILPFLTHDLIEDDTFLTKMILAIAEDISHSNIYQLASVTDSMPSPPFGKGNDEGRGNFMVMRGMTAKNFDPARYAGRWFEVASLKRGFAGQGQEDCHCTQGVYTFDSDTPAIQVDTFCVHGGPDGYITGIRGNVQCLSEEDKEKNQTDLEMQVMIKEKCYLRFPTLPFIPKEPYDVIATDYDNYALVSGAKDRSFIQIYSRTPNPGPKFIEKYKSYLAEYGYDPSKIKETPQDCEVMSNSQLAAMMSMSGMQKALTNQFPDLELKAPVKLNPFTSVFDTLKKLVELYFK